MQLAEFRDRQVIEPKGINLGGTGCGVRDGVDLEIDIPGMGVTVRYKYSHRGSRDNREVKLC